MLRTALQILWPAFVAAGVLELLVFAHVDPADVRWFGGPLIGWPPLDGLLGHPVHLLVCHRLRRRLTALLSLDEDAVNQMGGWPR